MAATDEPEGEGSLAILFEAICAAGGTPANVFAFLQGYPTASPLECLDVLLVDQRWRADSGFSIPTEEYLRACPGIASDPALKLDLVQGEILQRVRMGQSTDSESYATRFPELREALSHQSRVDRQVMDAERALTSRRMTKDVGNAPAEDDPGTIFHPGILAVDKPDDLDMNSRFSIRRQLGAGGMGVVYQAYDRQRRQMVALKTMKYVNPGALYRFKQEFRSLADLTHPNLAMLHELVAQGDHWYFTMELVEGTDFLSYVRPSGLLYSGLTTANPTFEGATSSTPAMGANSEKGRSVGLPSFEPHRLRLALVQLAEGLKSLHAAGKVHRDLKPSNVLVTRQGRVVILDFGLVAEIESTGGYQSTEQRVVGTVHYMAPEQAAASVVTAASDWYSVGVMLYQALTGRLPHVGSHYEVLTAKQRDDPRPPSMFESSIPEDLLSLCLDLLNRDPWTRPSGDEIIRRLAGGRVGEDAAWQATKLVTSISLVGRSRHLEALAEAFAEVKRGSTGIVCIHGRSGAGKSALVQKFLDGLAEREDAVILLGRCYEQESVPYKALDSLIDALSRYLDRLPSHQVESLLPRDVHPLTRVFPVLQRVGVIATAPRPMADPPDPNELRRRAFAALRELLARLGDRRPLVLAIDNLQWGDADSAILLSELFRPPDFPVMLAIACFRDEEAATNPFLLKLLRWREADGATLAWRDIKVEELTQAEACSLALSLLAQDGPASAEQAEMIARESVGNPFFVHELVQSLRAGGSPAGLGGTDLIALDHVLSARVDRFPVGARSLLEFVAVAGRPIPLDVAIRESASIGDGRVAIAILRSGRLVRIIGGEDSEEIETYHDRIREVVVQRLSQADLRARHLRLAEALVSVRDADAEFLAGHFYEGGDPTRAGHYYEIAAAQAAAALAFDRAAKLYRLSLSIRPEGDPERLPLLIELADALANAGRGAEAAREYLLAASDKQSIKTRELRRRAAMQLLISGHVDEGLSILRGILEASGMKLPGSSRQSLISLLILRLLLRLRGTKFVQRDEAELSQYVVEKMDTCWSVAAGLSLIDPIVGLSYQTRYVLLALRAGELNRVVRALAFEAGHRSIAGGFAQRQTARFLRDADALTIEGVQPSILGFLWLNRGMARYLEGGWKDAIRYCNQADEIFRERCTGVAWELDMLDTFFMWSLIYLGEIKQLVDRWSIRLRQARERGDRFAEMNFSTYIMSIAMLGEDRSAIAKDELERAKILWTPAGFHVQHHNVNLAQCHLHLYNDDGSSAWQYIGKQWNSYRKSFLFRIQQVRIDAMQLRARSAVAAAIHEPRPARLLKLAEREARRLDREKMAWSDAHAGAIRAMIAAGRGDLGTARARLEDAALRYDRVDMGLYAASARRRLGELIGGEEGRGLIERADSWMLDHGVKNPRKITNMYMPGFHA